VTAETVVTLPNATTVQGDIVTIDVRDGGVFLNNTAQVVATDIIASNGVIHVIDEVILPPFELPGDDLWLVTSDAPVYKEPGDTVAGSVTRCKTFFVTGYSAGFFELGGINSWIDVRAMSDVAENYGQAGGQEIVPGCEGN
jgi:hypothetical protein